MHAGYQRLLSSNGAADRPNSGISDIYYIPSKLSREFLELVDVFLRHRVFLEIAVPTIIRCLVEPTDVVKIRGVAVNDVAVRKHPWMYIKTQSLLGRATGIPSSGEFWRVVQWNTLSCTAPRFSHIYTIALRGRSSNTCMCIERINLS
ncbi:hypothetical protein NP493_48g03020 [Ridgeia piscesae]|uniref:Uncharacterized protein n=1 Tax=Ridgeia piscesae TaxID=27915 RepID=A0AAD9PBM8_RIDPI|nr:hypothetical protein NP493_48g03020 [Ridgeia piscesae]